MSNTVGNTRDLDAGRKEALQGLLSTLGHTSDKTSADGESSAEQVRKLSERIGEIFGGGGTAQADQPTQLLNEDGLPIIDISEPVNEDFEMNISPSHIPEQEFIPQSLLPHDEREQRRRERDRILDLLEEEERLQQLQEERSGEEERKEATKKRKESAKAELEQLKAVRELQKKMGRALIQSAKRAGENKQEEETHLIPQSASPVAKKSVSFADAPTTAADDKGQQTPIRQADWGDVTPGRLRAQNRIPLVSAAEAQKYPMKTHVVERCPTATLTPSSFNDADSDDESPSSTHYFRHTGNGSSDKEERSSLSEDLLDDEPLEEEFDYDAAQHHREIALEYHKRRYAIGAETAKAMAWHALDDYEEQETLLSRGQSPLSRLRADRMAAAYDKSRGTVSVSMGQTDMPASRTKSLRNSVKLGKLENDLLVGGDSGESGCEDEAVREVIQMLQTGSIQNAGPDFKSPPVFSFAPREDLDAVGSTTGPLTPAHGVKPSRFQLARATEGTSRQDNHSKDGRPQPTISNVVERKVPRSSTSQRFPINKPRPRSSVEASGPAPPMVIDSPSFPMTVSTSNAIPSSSPARTITVSSLSPHQTQVERLSPVESSSTQDSVTHSLASPRDTLCMARRTSK